jgi:hypothetical protein
MRRNAKALAVRNDGCCRLLIAPGIWKSLIRGSLFDSDLGKLIDDGVVG